MPSREEIRREVESIVREWQFGAKIESSLVSGILSYLHSQGVVIKVESKMPSNFILGLCHPNGNWLEKFCAVEPLINKGTHIAPFPKEQYTGGFSESVAIAD